VNSSSNGSAGEPANELPKQAEPFAAPHVRFLPSWAAPLFYFCLSLLFLYKSTLGGNLFLPGDLLLHAAPFAGSSAGGGHTPGLWNPLRWDGIAQFYPWRVFAAEALKSGHLPLWNPYQLSGTPFAANSQSAPFYPGNFLFVLLPATRAFAYSAVFHLTLAGWFTYLLARRLRCSEMAALFAGTAFAFSAWQTAWLQLPSFLATSCYIPLALAHIHAIFNGPRVKAAAKLTLTAGMMLLAGHLQIAFYGLIASLLWGAALLIGEIRRNRPRLALLSAAAVTAAFAGAALLAAPQLLPAVELSRISHRVSRPTPEGYALYTGYALPTYGLVQTALPGFFGGDIDPDNKYWGFYTQKVGDTTVAVRHNAAETAVYVGVVTMILGLYGLFHNLIPGAQQRSRFTTFFALLALLALLMALGTPLNYITYFGIPGFSQSGSPARILVLWALAWAILGGFGVDALLKPHRQEERLRAAAALVYLFIAAFGLSAAATALSVQLPGFKPLVPLLGDAIAKAGEDEVRLITLLTASVLLMLPAVKRKLAGSGPTLKSVGGVALLLVIIDLFAAGIRVNPVCSPEVVYPVTPGIAYLQQHIGHERMMPVNMHWSLYNGPKSVLPPNSGMVYRLRDVQGYDSLMPGAYKGWANMFAIEDSRGGGRKDSSPVEVANMIFFQNPNAPEVADTSAIFAVTPPMDSWNAEPGQAPSGQHLSEAQDGGLEIYSLPGRPRAELAAGHGNVTWKRDDINEVALLTQSDLADTLLLRDQRYPGWHASVDGQPAEIAGEARRPALRKVQVPAGSHIVTFVFAPASVKLGIYTALAMLAACTGVFIGYRRALPSS
jgi:hypothetical protein